ncbi:helix-turn-helix transcriptional regulator [Streptomyces sp. NPDC051921]|uniref:ArsR/SmtB family transcription factor n=1 Tax=Streptomyces sp. NPDC051921 TaxID=3155806 RepID=UPI00341C799F
MAASIPERRGAPAVTTATSPRVLEHPEREDIRLGPVLHALSDPVRLRIVRAMARGTGEAFSCSYFALPVTKSTSTHHFRVLRESGVVRQTYQGTAKLNSLRRDDLDALFPGLLDSVLAAADAQADRLGPERGEGRAGVGPAGRGPSAGPR